MSGDKPAKVFRAGGVRAAIWVSKAERDGQKVTEYSVQVDRSYKDKDGEFKHTSKFYPRDLPKLRLVAAKADEFCNVSEDTSDNETK